MEFKLYVTEFKSGLKEGLNSLPLLEESSINVETKVEIEEVLSSFKNDHGLEIASEPPFSVTEGSEFFKFLSSTKFVERLFFIIIEGKRNYLSKFIENACEVWKDEDGRFSSEILELLSKTFVSSLNNVTYKQLECVTLVEFLVKNRHSDALRALADAGFDPNIEKFIKRADHESIEFILQHTNLENQFLKSKSYFHLITFCYRCFPETFPKLKQIVFTLSSLYPGEDLKTVLTTKHSEYGGVNAVEYACRMQADQMLEVFWNLEHGFKTSMNENTWEYDVTNMIPDTVWFKRGGQGIENGRFEIEEPLMEEKKSRGEDHQGVSYLERIIASSVNGDKRAAKMIGLEPLRHMVHDYVIWSKLFRAALFSIQVVFMTIFTWHTLQHVNPKVAVLETCYRPTNTSTPSRHYNISEACIEAKKNIPSIPAEILFLLWPSLSFVFSMVQLVGLAKLIRGSGVGVGLKTILTSFPYYDLTLLICFVLRTVSLTSTQLSDSYFELVATIMILGWIRPTFYLSYSSYLSAFSVALKSSMVKYIVSFIFMFTFVYIGFSFSFKTLLTKHTHAELDKPINIIAYISFVTLFGMGELDQVPDAMEEKVDTVLFFKFVICMYCSCTAILILAMIRQPDEELVARVGSELKSRINLKFLKDISWLLVLRKRFKYSYLKEDMYGSLIYELKTLFGFEPRSYRMMKDRYSLPVTKEELSEGEEVARDDHLSENIENLQLQLASVHKVLLDIKTRLSN